MSEYSMLTATEREAYAASIAHLLTPMCYLLAVSLACRPSN
jgi:hypothetical protein